MTKEVKTYYNLDEAINNYEVKKEVVDETDIWWMLVNYKGRVYYTPRNYNPKENKIVEETMIKKIRYNADIYDRDEAFKKSYGKRI